MTTRRYRFGSRIDATEPPEGLQHAGVVRQHMDQCLPVDGDGLARVARPVVPNIQILEFRHVKRLRRGPPLMRCAFSGYVSDLGACRRIGDGMLRDVGEAMPGCWLGLTADSDQRPAKRQLQHDTELGGSAVDDRETCGDTLGVDVVGFPRFVPRRDGRKPFVRHLTATQKAPSFCFGARQLGLMEMANRT
ncbi:hypothetical protein X759_34110 [Mesorhizobium sp. LSHC420B00]|uniref:hypothetical protein n=1 Tax=unclassified Mesorhizobium TaxID=325217 RepID=UPI0003CF7614|nr:hypothetical protein [Mesorhizobium sp. LSHC420B00]ESX62741.1 hypothetical protein X759_34110 [Mesorhizobium sp. LSHC420B00]